MMLYANEIRRVTWKKLVVEPTKLSTELEMPCQERHVHNLMAITFTSFFTCISHNCKKIFAGVNKFLLL